jgi:hypothetical protein
MNNERMATKRRGSVFHWIFSGSGRRADVQLNANDIKKL